MNIKHKGVLVPEDGTDSFINCKLDRRQYASILTDIVSTYSDGFVLAVNNEWGAGKTTFIKMWRQQLENEDYKTLYYNAWENDFEKDVLVALISELKELENEAKEKFKKVIDKAAPLTTKLLPALAKGIASKYVGDEFVKELINGFADVTAEGLKEEIQAYANRKRSLVDFKTSLEKFVKEASPDKPVVFFIDELDRCRPNYAVEVLETVKHLFNVSGIVFVLSIDKEQLGHAVKGVYGSEGLNANEYLRRFIDLEYKIPEPNLQNYIDYLFEYYQFAEFFNNEKRSNYKKNQDISRFKIIGFDIFRSKKLKLRQIEKLYARARLVLKGFHLEQIVFPELIVFMTYLEDYESGFFRDIKRNALNLQEFCVRLDEILNPIDQLDDNHRILSLYASMLYRYYVDLSGIQTVRKVELLKADDSLNVQSKLENEYNKLAGIILKLEKDHYASDLGLSWVIQRIALTTTLQS